MNIRQARRVNAQPSHSHSPPIEKSSDTPVDQFRHGRVTIRGREYKKIVALAVPVGYSTMYETDLRLHQPKNGRDKRPSRKAAEQHSTLSHGPDSVLGKAD